MSSDNSDEIEMKQLTFIYKDLETNKKQLVFHYYVDNFSEYDIHNAKIFYLQVRQVVEKQRQ